MPFFRLPEVFYTTPEKPTFKVKYGPKKSMNHISVRIPDGHDMEGPYPLLIVLHGGKWKTSYTAKQMEYICADLRHRGIATCNVEFRRLGHVGGGWPNTFLELADAIDYIWAHHSDWNVAYRRISFLGHSSGGHLALSLCAMDKFLDRKLPFTPRSAIALASVFDLKTLEGLQKEVEQFFGDAPIIDPTSLLPLGIPQLVICGSKDRLLGQATAYLGKALEAGDDVKMVEIDKCSHLRIIDPTAPYWPLIRENICSFIWKSRVFCDELNNSPEDVAENRLNISVS